MTLHIEPFHSSKTPWEVFRNVHSASRTCFFLDSPQYAPPDQVYSYIGTDPAAEVRLEGQKIIVSGKKNRSYPAAGLFPLLRRILRRGKGRTPSLKSGRAPFFTGGLMGYFGYEAARFCDKVGFRRKKELGIPGVYFGLFRNVIVYDHRKRVYYLVSNAGRRAAHAAQIERMKGFFKASPRAGRSFRLKKITPEMTRARFKRMVRRAKEYIAAGDIYQANLSQRFSFEHEGSSLELYGTLRTINPSPFSCFLKTKDVTIVSASPERLIRKKGRVCETRPIAGTCPARGAAKGPARWRRKLLQSEKEKAEHLMLVDLERNDLGRVCDYRSVKVREFMTLEKYSHVVHIVSKVTGHLKKSKDAIDVIRAMFPGGTITGCPKIRCMQIIDELEPVRRGIYTGSLGYIGFGGDMDLNIVIRTLILRGHKGFLQVGAGIVYDSDPEREYQETLHKGEALRQALMKAGDPS